MHLLHRLAQIVFLVGLVALCIYYGSTNEPLWPLVVVIVALLVLGGTPRSRTNGDPH